MTKLLKTFPMLWRMRMGLSHPYYLEDIKAGNKERRVLI